LPFRLASSANLLAQRVDRGNHQLSDWAGGVLLCYNPTEALGIVWVMMNDVRLNVAQIVPYTEAEGPGRRFALWFQGCPLRCPGCCNPEMLPFEGGRAVALADVLRQVRDAAAGQGVGGI